MLMADPRPADAERLKGYEYSRVTAGEYRIVFDVRDGVLCVVVIGKRNDAEVYRRSSRVDGLRGRVRQDLTAALLGSMRLWTMT